MLDERTSINIVEMCSILDNRFTFSQEKSLRWWNIPIIELNVNLFGLWTIKISISKLTKQQSRTSWYKKKLGIERHVSSVFLFQLHVFAQRLLHLLFRSWSALNRFHRIRLSMKYIPLWRNHLWICCSSKLWIPPKGWCVPGLLSEDDPAHQWMVSATCVHHSLSRLFHLLIFWGNNQNFNQDEGTGKTKKIPFPDLYELGCH